MNVFFEAARQFIASADLASPLSPAPFEWLLIIVGFLQLLFVFALLFWLPRQLHISPLTRLLGLVVALMVPLLGPVAVWWVLRRRPDTCRE